MKDEEFNLIVEGAIKSIPEEFKKKIKNVSIVIQEMPTKQQILKLKKRGRPGFLLGLYEGVPQTKRRHYGVGGQLPDKITIFKRPILAIARSKVHLIEIVVNTVKHEIAHHFGMDEEMIKDAERAR